MAKAPQARGFTLAEKRSLQFERVALYMVLLVALIAAAISFQALDWLGQRMGLGWASPLVPLAIDGFAIACSVGIVRSQGSGEAGRERVSEWVGLFLALALSIAGNVQHALSTKHDEIPVYLAGAMSAAIPVIVAYGIHVYGRAMARGISAHVLADNPDQLTFGIAHLGDDNAQSARAPKVKPRAQAPAPVRAPAARPAAQPARETGAQVEQVKVVPAAAMARITEVHNGLKAAARELYDEAIATDPTTKPDAAAIHKAIGSEKNPATTRRWVQAWWDEQQAVAEPDRDPILEQVGEEKGRDEVRAATA